jgi:hypothetical protein
LCRRKRLSTQTLDKYTLSNFRSFRWCNELDFLSIFAL